MKLKPPRTLPQLVLEVLSALTVLLQFLLPLVFWAWLPEKIPSHYNMAGEIDGWGSRGTLFILAGVSLFIWVLIGIVGRIDPRNWNIPFTVPWGREAQVYGAIKTMLAALELETVLIFAVEELAMALGRGEWILPASGILCVLMFITVAVGLRLAWRQRFR